jgi:hypothetical protein
MKAMTLLLLLLSVSTLPGCTTRIVTRPLDRASPAPVEGWDYSLPFAQYDISIVRVLESCSIESNQLKLDLDTTVKATVRYERDPAYTFTIDYQSLSSPTKISDFQIEKHPNAMLKRIGVTAEDRTGPIIVNTFTTIANLAATASMVAGGRADMRAGACAPEVEAALARLPALRAPVKAAQARLERATAELEAITGNAAVIGGRPSAAIQAEILARANAVVARRAELAEATGPYTETLKVVSETQVLAWPKDGNERTHENDLGPQTLMRWAGSRMAKKDRCLIFFELHPASELAAPQGPGADAGARQGALRYRVPVKGRLEARYNGQDCGEPDQAADRRTLIEAPVPQLGRIYLLPFENGPFQNNLMNATFSEDGNLVSAGYAEKTAAAETATQTAAQVSAALPQALRSVYLGGTQFQTERNDALTKMLQSEANLEKAREALDPPAASESAERMALLAADTALKQAELANIAATFALERARNDPSTTLPE